MSDNKKDIASADSEKKTDAKKSSGGFKRAMDRVSKFFREYRSELKKISWPTFAEVLKNTGITLVVVAIIGVCIWLFDWGVSALRDTLITTAKQAEISDIVSDTDASDTDLVVSDSETSDSSVG